MQNKIIILFLLFINSIYSMENYNQLKIEIKKNLEILNHALDFAKLTLRDENNPQDFKLLQNNFIEKESKLYEPEELKNELDKIRIEKFRCLALAWGLFTSASICFYTATTPDDPNRWAIPAFGFSSSFLFIKTFFDKSKHKNASEKVIDLYRKLKG